MSRRAFLRLSGLAGSAVFLAACAGQSTPAATQQQAPAAPEQAAEEKAAVTESEAPAAETATISWWNQYSTETTKVVIPQIVDQFQELNPSITVDYEISGGPPGGGDYIEVLLTRIAAGSAPDSITLWSPPSQFGARGSLLSIDDFMANAKIATPDAFYEGPLKSCQWQGKTYGLPASAGAGCIFFNTDKFEEKGLSTKRDDFPTTWAEMADL
jgi:multiple sugar transport system substrate-binding protein